MDYRASRQDSFFHNDGDIKPEIFFGDISYSVTERDLSYRFFLHQHPYVNNLMQQLIRKGTSGLLAADTDYDEGGQSLPYGVDVEFDTEVELTVTEGSKIRFLDSEDDSEQEYKLINDTEARFFKDTVVTIVDVKDKEWYPRKSRDLPKNTDVVVTRHTIIEFLNTTEAEGVDGTLTPVPGGKKYILLAGSHCIPKHDVEVTVVRKQMMPIKDFYSNSFPEDYQPTDLVQEPYPVKDLDFSSSGAYAVYNWELFYHVPITIAIHLSKNQRFAEAMKWFHYIFDPTDNSEGPTPERFWKVRPFQETDVRKIETILTNLATNEDPGLYEETIDCINAWKAAPFRPHLIARYRQQSYMYKTVMAYLDNLIDWGDSLFRQDTGEAIDEALQLYILAANILGHRPQPVPKKGSVRPKTYASLRKDLKQFGTVMQEIEPDIPFNLTSDLGDSTDERYQMIRSMGKALYFDVPPNDKFLGYWDTVEDRLFKIRNSLNIHGMFRQLALFEPPIDPAMLARATAAGLDVASIVNGLNQPLPLVRFQLLVQKASEIVQEVKSLGGNLLSAMEKEEGEAMAILRAKHERQIMEMVEQVKYGQLQEAVKSREGILQSLALAVQRYTFYEKQLGREQDEIHQVIEEAVEALGELDADGFNKMKLSMEEPKLGLRDIEADIAEDLTGSGGKIINSHEHQEFIRLERAQNYQEEANGHSMIAKMLSIIPETGIQGQPTGVGGVIQFGGRELSRQMSFIADAKNAMAGKSTYQANMAAKMGSYARREQEWSHQSNLAIGEINQIFKQLRSAQLRQAIAEIELNSHRKQMDNAREIEQFLNEEGIHKKGKKTNKALYTWMKREVKGLYSQCFQFAFDVAKKAERALQHELGNTDLNYIKFGYLAGKEGLLAGEKLYFDIKRMEMAYHELNQREYELTRHISILSDIDGSDGASPTLASLKSTGSCTIQLTEALFDKDCPGHYFRRIKNVAVSIPCVTGPYTSVNCKLTLLKSSIRKKPDLTDGEYIRQGTEDPRFDDYFGSMQSIVTSSGQNDSGLFETNLRDERYLPFENSGVISEWRLELPPSPEINGTPKIDYNTISDVILHIRYTAREGGELLKQKALT